MVAPSALFRIRSVKKGSKVADVFHTLEPKHTLDQLRAGLCSKRGRHQIAGLGDYFIASHRVLRCAAHVLDALAELRPIGEGKLNDRHPHRYQALEIRIGDKLYFGALPE